jgi:unsaturated chondroitin disaccharide hydrolase
MASRSRLLDLVCERVLATRAAIGTKWPVDEDRRDGKWSTTNSPDWTWGLWVESLRLVGERKKDPSLREEARERTIERAAYLDQHDLARGAAFYYSAARLASSSPTPDEEMKDLALDAARAVSDMADDVTGGRPLGRDGGGNSTHTLESALLGTALDWYAAKTIGDKNWIVGARKHLDFTIGDLLKGETPEPSSEAVRQNHGNPFRSRRLALAVAGYYRAWETTRDRKYLDAGDRIVDYLWLNSGADHMPPRDPTVTGPGAGPADTAAAAIIASAIARLCVLNPLPELCRRHAQRLGPLLDSLAHHVTPIDPSDKRPHGMLVEAGSERPHAPPGSETLIGNFYLLEALTCLDRKGLPC